MPDAPSDADFLRLTPRRALSFGMLAAVFLGIASFGHPLRARAVQPQKPTVHAEGRPALLPHNERRQPTPARGEAHRPRGESRISSIITPQSHRGHTPAQPASQPWNFPAHNGPISARAKRQYPMRKNSGYFGRDSPFPAWMHRPLVGRSISTPADLEPVVLTGTAWHYSSDAVAAAGSASVAGSLAQRCSAHGVWSAALGRCGGLCCHGAVRTSLCTTSDASAMRSRMRGKASGIGELVICHPTNRCDCAPYHWGSDCSLPVVTKGICVMNDSRPWFCDKPACIHSSDERPSPLIPLKGGHPLKGLPPYKFGPSRCVGEPLDGCPLSCSGNGVCEGGKCQCFVGFRGEACTISVEWTGCLNNCSNRGNCLRGFCHCKPPFWGTDCAMRGGGDAGSHGLHGRPDAAGSGVVGAAEALIATKIVGGDGPRCQKRPCIYVYELPARMNVLALKVEHDWREQYVGRKFDYRAPLLFHEALLGSPHRTSMHSEADFFYVPTWDFQGSWGNPEVYYRAARYISQLWPFWNRTGGRDHLWAVARDAGACATPWGSLRDEMANATLLLNWGGVTGLSGRHEERCYSASKDLVIPGSLTHSTVAKSPFWLPAAEVAAIDTNRSTTLFFIGALCWKLDKKARTMDELKSKCDSSFNVAGFLSRYSFGLRYQIFRLFSEHQGFKLFATDYPPSMPQGGVKVDVNAEILQSRYCLCPSGTGWGMRMYHAIILGCVPVITQDDGVHPRVVQAFEPTLAWERFSVIVPHAAIGNLSAMLDATDLAAKQAELRRVWNRMVWRGALRPPLRDRLPAPDAFDATIDALGELLERRRNSV